MSFLGSSVAPVLYSSAAIFGVSLARRYFSLPSPAFKARIADKKEVLKTFQAGFPSFRNEFVEYVSSVHGLDNEAVRSRISRMLDYTCNGGKMTRGLTVVTTMRDVLQAKQLGDDAVDSLLPKAVALGWCIEILQACFLVADDVMDHSETRRGQPCWYKLPDVGLDAVNDALILESFLFFLLRSKFKNHREAAVAACYVPLLELFQEAALKTQMGQMLDLMSQPQGRKGPELLASFTLDRYKAIVKFKTAYYSFYLPLSCGLVLGGFSDPKSLAIAREIAIELGEKFQIQDDVLDCFGDPEHTGKIGTDIRDHKCTWLVVQALQLATESQLDLIKTYYGREEPEAELRVKQLYDALDLRTRYAAQEAASHARITTLIEEQARPHGLPVAIFTSLLDLIHLRTK